jgi:hypothetical protein
METTGATKEAPVIRQLLDEALGARRRKAMGITDAEEPPGQGTAETLRTLQTLQLKLIKRGELIFRRQDIVFRLLKEAAIDARAGREVVFQELVERPWLERGKTRETMSNYFDLKTSTARQHVNEVVEKIQKEEALEYERKRVDC